MIECAGVAIMATEAFKASIKRLVNVGTIGHFDYGKTALSKDIYTELKARKNKADRKRDRLNRWR
jgi:translation elongation factor EF-Tu-like GTPase